MILDPAGRSPGFRIVMKKTRSMGINDAIETQLSDGNCDEDIHYHFELTYRQFDFVCL